MMTKISCYVFDSTNGRINNDDYELIVLNIMMYQFNDTKVPAINPLIVINLNST